MVSYDSPLPAYTEPIPQPPNYNQTLLARNMDIGLKFQIFLFSGYISRKTNLQSE